MGPWKSRKMTTAITLRARNLHHSKDEKCAGLRNEITIHVHILKVSIQTGGGMT